MTTVEAIAEAVLYEGYLLWPYRRSAMKNQKRWTLGGVYPRAFSEDQKECDPWLMQTQCLVTGDQPVLEVKVRFLHVVERQVRQYNPDGSQLFVEQLDVGSERYLAWEEATEREFCQTGLGLTALERPRCFELYIPAGSSEERLTTPEGTLAGALVRTWHALHGVLEVTAQVVGPELYRVTVKVSNLTLWQGQDREHTLRQTFVSTHTLLTVTGGEFVSLMDPPESLRAAAERCENLKTWPVLVGEADQRQTMLSSPIILYDYPRLAPESPGNLFDSGEIDKLLILNVLSLTDAEKAEMRATDPRAREILERSESLTTDDFMRLHGAIRDFRELPALPESLTWFAELERPVPQQVIVGGVALKPGSKVRLRPRPGCDIYDLVLAGQLACIEAIEQDYEDRIHLAVTLEIDPGLELGLARQPGHRFFFAPEEVEPLVEIGSQGANTERSAYSSLTEEQK